MSMFPQRIDIVPVWTVQVYRLFVCTEEAWEYACPLIGSEVNAIYERFALWVGCQLLTVGLIISVTPAIHYCNQRANHSVITNNKKKD